MKNGFNLFSTPFVGNQKMSVAASLKTLITVAYDLAEDYWFNISQSLCNEFNKEGALEAID